MPQERWALEHETAIFKGLRSSKYTHPVETLRLVDLYWSQMCAANTLGHRRRRTGAAWSNDPVGQGSSTPCSRPFQPPHKSTDANARAVTLNPATEHVGRGKMKYLCRRRRQEEVKQMGTFRAAACLLDENNQIEAERRGIKSNFVRPPVSTKRLRSPEGHTVTIWGTPVESVEVS